MIREERGRTTFTQNFGVKGPGYSRLLYTSQESMEVGVDDLNLTITRQGRRAQRCDRQGGGTILRERGLVTGKKKRSRGSIHFVRREEGRTRHISNNGLSEKKRLCKTAVYLGHIAVKAQGTRGKGRRKKPSRE